MADHILLVHTNAVEGREVEFNEWYDDRHIPDVLAVPGFVAAQRFKASPSQRTDRPAPTHRYVAVYEIEGDPAEALRHLIEAGAAGMEISSAMAPGATACVFAPMGPKVERSAVS